MTAKLTMDEIFDSIDQCRLDFQPERFRDLMVMLHRNIAMIAKYEKTRPIDSRSMIDVVDTVFPTGEIQDATLRFSVKLVRGSVYTYQTRLREEMDAVVVTGMRTKMAERKK